MAHVEDIGDPSACPPGPSSDGTRRGTRPPGSLLRLLTRVPSDIVNRCRWAGSQRPKARSMAVANWAR